MDLIAMWKKPKMVIYVLVTAILYPALIYPFQQYSFFAASADYLRIGMGIPVAFSFLFGPAAAWGAALGNLIYDVTTGLNAASIFGFIGNFLIAYVPYKLWATITTEKPDLRSAKKVLLFTGISILACSICGLIIGWGLLYLFSLSFAMTTFTIITTDALWAILLGSVILALTYRIICKHKLLYTDILSIKKRSLWNKKRSMAIIIFSLSTISCLTINILFDVGYLILSPFVLISLISILIACK